MENEPTGDKKKSGGDLTIDSFRPEDAEGIVRLFLSVYGEHYPIRLFYDPEAIIAANREGRYYSIVARTDSGEVIGVSHLYRSAPYPNLYESGVGLVAKEYRNSGANKRLLGYLYEDFVVRTPHIEEVFGEAVCNHPYMQKAIAPSRFVETAIEVALMPAEAYAREESARGRVATIVAFRCYKPRPYRVILPGAYEKPLRLIYGRLDDTRYLDTSRERIPPYSESAGEMTIFDHAGVARIAVYGIGEEFLSYISNLEYEAQEKNVVVFHVWLKANTPWISQAVDILRDMGYFLGGVLPRWFNCDGLLMQKVLCPPDFDGIVLESDFSKELLEIIKEDWKRANP
ncbi:MAG: hypothetical protein PHN75_08530 [Syntrophales bacterium]|nr:hypothetical protein [Syntrophales bacterium]